MANPTTGYFPLTGDNVIDSLTNGYKWNLDSSRTIDFSVSGGLNGEYWNNPAVVAQQLSAELSTFSLYANIKFNYVGSFANPMQAANAGSEINLTLSASYTIFPNSSTWAVGKFPNPNDDSNPYSGVAGDIYLNLNSAANNLPSYAPGSAGWALLVHELGHTLGLKHPHDDGGTGRPTFSQVGAAALNIDVFSVMSYNDAAQWNLISWDPATPMILDVLALQALYGKNLLTNAGNTVHYLKNDSSYSTIWDASGIDTIDLSGGTEGWAINLPTAAWSSVVDTKVGGAVPTSQYNSLSPTTYKWLAGDFENIIGTGYGDLISGNQFNNQIKGGAGNDTIDGGTGFDTAIYTGTAASHTISIGTTGAIVIDKTANRDGTDTLTNVERLSFTDTNVALDNGRGQNAGEAYRIYKAAFNRTPDTEGLGFWIKSLDNGNSLNNVSQGFIGSPEFQRIYGANSSDTTFLNNIYTNVLGRNYDQSGYDFWLNGLKNGLQRDSLLSQFSESVENCTNVAPLIGQGIQYKEYLG